MNTLDIATRFFTSFAEKIFAAIPGLLGAIVVLLMGYVLARALAAIVKKIAVSLKIEALEDKLKEIDLLKSLDIKLSILLSKLVYWVVLMIFVIAASEILGLKTISEGIAKLLGYLPQLISATLFFAVGMILANGIRGIIDIAFTSMGVPTGRIISTFIFYFLLIMIVITSLNQAGMDTQVIAQNVSTATAAIFFAFAMAYGFASRDILSNLLASFYSRDKFKIGQKIRIDGVTGVIVSTDATSVTLQAEDRQIILPLQKLINSNVEIFNNE